MSQAGLEKTWVFRKKFLGFFGFLAFSDFIVQARLDTKFSPRKNILFLDTI